MKISVPELSLVILIGASGSCKSSFAREHFKPTEVLSSDFCRGLVSDDENDQAATKDAFDVLNYIAGKRLAGGRLTVVDATNVQQEARKPLVALARAHDVLPVAIVLNMPEQLCQERNRDRPDRAFGPHVVRNQVRQLKRSLKRLKKEGFRHVSVLSSPEEVAAATVERQRLWTNLKHESGPFDIIGDVHGCHKELVDLLEHPAEAFAYYRHEGIPRVVCEEKHMGSRAVVVVCKDEDAARSRFGTSDGAGVVNTRTGRPFFREELQDELLERLRQALDQSGMWEEFETDWFCLDCEILPWSAKAEELLRRQYAAVGAASRPALSEAVAALEGAEERDLDVGQLLMDYRERREAVESYVETYRRYCWPVHSLDDIQVAPFHLLATEGAVHVDKDHLWHLRQLARLCAADDGLLIPTGT